MNRRRIIVTLALGFFGIALVLFANLNRPIAFDAIQWREAKAAHDYNTLFAMSNDVITSLNSEKISRKDVILKLGEPDYSGEAMLHYNLGNHRYHTLVSNYWKLTIFFNGETVSKAFNNPG
jgi:hypothetical protein